MSLLFALPLACSGYAQGFEIASVQVIQQRLGATNVESTRGNLIMKNIGLGSVANKEMSAFAMVQTKTGHKWKPVAASEGSVDRTMRCAKLDQIGEHAGMNRLAFLRSESLGIAVLDKPDLTSHRTGASGSGDSPEDPVAVVPAGLAKQSGFRFQARKMPVDMLWIDHIETKPVEN
jgi:uncharacterized protein (TIGR03435 family)